MGRQKVFAKNPSTNHSEVKDYFIRNLSRAGRSPEYIPSGSPDICLWRCKKCDNEYELSMNRFVKGTRCPKHIGEKLRIISMSNPKFPKLKDTNPYIFSQLVEIIEYPSFDINLTNKNLRQDCLWRCKNCGYEWVAKPYVRVKPNHDPSCRKCKNK